MKQNLGIIGLLVAIVLVTASRNPQFLTAYNLENVVKQVAPYGIIGIGVAFVIITGGIDLSIGSVVGLVGCLLPWLIVKQGWPVPLALAAVMLLAVSIGVLHGLLITKLRLQSFVVTLCGLLFYRGFARYFTGDSTQGFGTAHEDLRQIAIGKIPLGFIPFSLPVSFLVLVAVALLAGFFLNFTIYGRYLFALGRNEQATRLSGIDTDRMKLLAYVVCSSLAGLGGILFSLEINSVQPAGHGNFYELYAIAAAVLGGCSLRGGEGTILGVVIGAAVMRVLYNAINILGIPTQLEFAVIGVVILMGVITDEVFQRLATHYRALEQAKLKQT